MSKKDQLTNRGPLYGNKISHSVRHTRRRWELNLQSVRLEVTPGKFQNVKVSSKTIKTLKKQGKLVNKFAKKSTATPTNL